MTSSEIEARLSLSRQLIAEAGAVALDYFERVSTLTVTSKGPQDMVSEADVAVETLIRDRLTEAFPGDAFLGEEGGHAEAVARGEASAGPAGVWVVDPIDGTQPFVSGMSSWCVSIGYVRDNAVQFGLVFNPAADELFVGGADLPATRNGQLIAPHPGTALTDGLTFLGCSSRMRPDQVVPVLDRLMKAGGMFVRNGSGALGLCDVACGRLVGYVEPHINSWDCLGAIGVLQGAGARVSQFLTPTSLLHGNHIVAATPAVYDELEQVLGLGG